MVKIILDHKSAPMSSSQLLQLCLGISGFQSEVRRDVLIGLDERKHGPTPATWLTGLSSSERAPVFPGSMHPWPGGRQSRSYLFWGQLLLWFRGRRACCVSGERTFQPCLWFTPSSPPSTGTRLCSCCVIYSSVVALSFCLSSWVLKYLLWNLVKLCYI